MIFILYIKLYVKKIQGLSTVLKIKIKTKCFFLGSPHKYEIYCLHRKSF